MSWGPSGLRLLLLLLALLQERRRLELLLLLGRGLGGRTLRGAALRFGGRGGGRGGGVVGRESLHPLLQLLRRLLLLLAPVLYGWRDGLLLLCSVWRKKMKNTEAFSEKQTERLELGGATHVTADKHAGVMRRGRQAKAVCPTYQCGVTQKRTDTDGERTGWKDEMW